MSTLEYLTLNNMHFSGAPSAPLSRPSFQLTSLSIIQPSAAAPLSVETLEWLCGASPSSIYDLKLTHSSTQLLDYINTHLTALSTLWVPIQGSDGDSSTYLATLLEIARLPRMNSLKLANNGSAEVDEEEMARFHEERKVIHWEKKRDVIEYELEW